MFYVFLLVLAALGIGIYLIVFLGNVPGAAAERFARKQPRCPAGLAEAFGTARDSCLTRGE